MNRLTFHASRLRHSPGGAGPETVVPGRNAAGSQTRAATSAGNAQTASDASHEPSACSSGTASPAASAAPSVRDIEYAPVSRPVISGWRRRISTGSTAWAIATASPDSAQPANSGAHPPAPRSAAAAAVSSAQASSTRSIETRRVSRGASGAKAPNASTGSVVSSPAASPESPRSACTWFSSGGRLATSVRRLSASSTIAVIARRQRAGARLRTRRARSALRPSRRRPARRLRPSVSGICRIDIAQGCGRARGATSAFADRRSRRLDRAFACLIPRSIWLA